ECRSVGRRGLGALASDEIKLRDLLALLRRSDQGSAPVELADDFENRLFALRRRRPVCQQSSNPQMNPGARGFRDHRISGFLHPVMDEVVGVSAALDQFLTERIPESHVNLVW